MIDKVKILKNDEREIANLYNSYYKLIYRTIFNVLKEENLTEDLTTEVFLKIIENIEKYTEDISFSNWIKTLAYNYTIDHIRRNKNKPVRFNEIDEVILFSDCGNPEKDIIKSQQNELLMNAIDLLPKKQKELVYKRYFREMSYNELANELLIPIGTVKNYLNKARKTLKKIITNN